MDTIQKLRNEIEEIKKEMLLAAIFGERDKIKLCKETIAQQKRLIAMLESRKK